MPCCSWPRRGGQDASRQRCGLGAPYRLPAERVPDLRGIGVRTIGRPLLTRGPRDGRRSSPACRGRREQAGTVPEPCWAVRADDEDATPTADHAEPHPRGTALRVTTATTPYGTGGCARRGSPQLVRHRPGRLRGRVGPGPPDARRGRPRVGGEGRRSAEVRREGVCSSRRSCPRRGRQLGDPTSAKASWGQTGVTWAVRTGAAARPRAGGTARCQELHGVVPVGGQPDRRGRDRRRSEGIGDGVRRNRCSPTLWWMRASSFLGTRGRVGGALLSPPTPPS